MKKGSPLFALAMGITMILVWTVYIATGHYELGSQPLEALSLLVAELSTAFALIVGGAGALRSRTWGLPVHLASLGMMLYTSIYSVGVFADIRAASAFFTALALTTVIVILALSRTSITTPNERS